MFLFFFIVQCAMTLLVWLQEDRVGKKLHCTNPYKETYRDLVLAMVNTENVAS